MTEKNLTYESQVCFPLYVCSKEIIRMYQPFLDELDLTYTQYITLLALWEKDNINIKELGNKLYLDSGTLTPLLKKLEDKGYIRRNKNKNDERNLIIKLTEKGILMEENAKTIPKKVSKCVSLNSKDIDTLNIILRKIIKCINKK